MDENLEFEHHGIKGMKWGVRRTPEQLGHPTTPKKSTSKSKDEKLSERQKKKQEKLQKKADELKKKAEKEREAILRSPSKLYKNRDKFTKEEIDAAMRRFKWEQELRNMSKSEMNTGKEYVDMILGYADTGMKAYNTAARLYNTFGAKQEKDKMKMIPGVGEAKKKK